MKKALALLCLVAASLLVFAACKESYRNDLTPYELADHLETEGVGGLLRQMDDQVGFYGELQIDSPFALRLAEDGSNLDEFAVFSCENETQAKALAKRLNDYLKERYEKDRDWYLSYIPEELPKLQRAEVKTFGNYVAYAILSQNERNRAFDLLHQKLLQIKTA
ncbi:MAG: DUF4358 domain-containing protein [Clostridia bacterium]|nr:DUF4358 domain-containing protein [Clostridia bacterium]